MKTNKGRYQNDERKSEKKVLRRRYMSYEDVPLEDYQEEQTAVSGSMAGKILKMFIILFLAVIAVLAIMNIERLTPENIAHWFQYDLLGKTEGSGYPVNFVGSAVSDGNFDVISGVPIYCSDTTIAVLNQNAGTYQETQHSFASPVMSVNGGYAIIYNIDATGYSIVKRDSVIHTSSVKQRICAADVSSGGVYAILTKSNDYLSSLTVYRSDNLEKYKYSFADYYMNTVSINNDGSRAVLTGVSARNGGLTSVIYVLDFSEDSYIRKYEVDDTFIYSVKYLDNGCAFCVGNNKAFYIDIGDDKKTDIDYESRTLTAYTLSRSRGAVLALSKNPDGRECDLVAYDKSGNLLCDIKTGKKVVSADMKNGRYAILTPEEIVVYDGDGNKKSGAKTDTDAKKIIFTDNSSFYVLGKSMISHIFAE